MTGLGYTPDHLRKLVEQVAGREPCDPVTMLVDLQHVFPQLVKAYLALAEARPVTREAVAAWLRAESRSWFTNAGREADRQRFDNGAQYAHYAGILEQAAKAVADGTITFAVDGYGNTMDPMLSLPDNLGGHSLISQYRRQEEILIGALKEIASCTGDAFPVALVARAALERAGVKL